MPSLRDHVMSASTRPEVRDAVAHVYENLQREIDARKPLCSASGRCCRFEEYGHRLYVTTIELAAFVHDLAESSLPLPGTPGRGASDAVHQPALDRAIHITDPARPDAPRTLPLSLTLSPEYRGEGTSRSGACPFQLQGLCSVHTIRPFGCRVFFCDSTSDDWQHTQYERFHADLKRLHEQLGVPYQYLEWRQALRELGLMPAVATETSPTTAKPLSLPQLRF